MISKDRIMLKQRKLKNYLLYPSFQLTLVILNVSILIISLIVIHYKITDVFEKLRIMGETAHLTPNHLYFDFVNKSNEMMTSNLNWAIGFSIFFTTLASILLSHRVVGPMYRIKMYFTDLANEGTDREINFRKGDYFSELPPIINAGLKKIKSK